ncbi:MAG TPA: sigma-70 family RNA polymerase sigma factor [Anaerolineae bacterium]
MSESEEQLIERAKQNADAFGLLYERYVDRIYNYIYYRTGDTHEAEDLTARVFYRALGHMDHYRQRGAPFAAWLYRIAHNLVANWHRDRSRRKDVRLDDIVAVAEKRESPEHRAEQDEETRILLGVMGKLPAERQQLLILKFVDGMSNAEIARVMGRSEGAIKSLYHRTLIALRDDLNTRGMSQRHWQE